LRHTYNPNDDALGESKREDKNACSVTHSLHTLHNTEKKEPRSIRVKPSHYKSVSTYAKMADMTVGDVFIEGAFILMQLEPVNGSLIIVENGKNNQQDLDDWMGELVCIQELSEFIEMVDSRTKPKHRLHKNLIRELQKILKECKKIKNRSPELDALITTVRGYFAE
jgi:hypothetical protein